ncbi:MAG: hypothetical protein JHD16_02065 [Solirubrobacteraceae bacterium]|nr:hypothetical protein [Solirubrobacteraceae bacterium]
MRSRPLITALVAGTVAVAAGVFVGGAVLAPDHTSAQETPVSSLLPVSRRADPSLDRYTRTPKPRTGARSLNGAQQWLSAKAQPLVAHDSDPTVSLHATGWASGPNVAVYVNATGVNLYNRQQLHDASRWLVRRGKTPVLVDGWHMLDVRQPEARRWWLYGSDGRASCISDRNRRSVLDLIACGYRGLWVDNVLTVPAQWFKPDPGIDAAEWGNALVALLQELRYALPQGVPFTINAHWTDLDFPYATDQGLNFESPLVRAARAADQLVIEGGAIDPGLNYAGSATDQWSYRRLLAYADAMHAAGVRLQWEKTSSDDLTRNATRELGTLPSCRDGDYARAQPAWRQGDRVWRAHVRTAAFNLASALLTLAPGDSVGDMCEYPGRGWRGYGAEFGAPLGPREDDGRVVLRRFAQGLIAVNPSGKAVTVTLPEGRLAINLASLANPKKPRVATSRFRIPARSALVAKYYVAPQRR